MKRRDLLKTGIGFLLAPLAIFRGQAPAVNVVSPKRLWEAREQERAERDEWEAVNRDLVRFELRHGTTSSTGARGLYDPVTQTIRIV